MSDGLLVVTCARDEAAHLPALVASMRAQTCPPQRWVVVDDRSRDATPAILAAAAAEDDLREVLHVVTVDGTDDRSFRSKVDAFTAGVAHGRAALASAGTEARFLACIDADVVLPPEFFERVLAAFAADPVLGVTGARYRELVRGELRLDLGAADQIVGMAQVFRIETYDAIGGYQALPLGGEDTMANVDARRLGWRTEVVDGLVIEHRKGDESLGVRRALRSAYRQGRCDRDVGTLWWFEAAKVARRVRERPAPLVALARAAGFLVAAVRRVPRDTAAVTVAAHRAEQRARLRRVPGSVRRRGTGLA